MMENDKAELLTYRLVVPMWLFNACLREYKLKHGEEAVQNTLNFIEGANDK